MPTHSPVDRLQRRAKMLENAKARLRASLAGHAKRASDGQAAPVRPAGGRSGTGM